MGIMGNRTIRLLAFVFILILVGPFVVADLSAQPPGRGGPGGPGGPSAPDLKILDEYDSDDDGILNKEERAKARAFLKERSESDGANRRGGRGGPGARGRGRGGRGPGGRGGARKPGTEGPKVNPDDVEVFPKAELYDEGVLRTLFIQFEQDDWEQELADFKPTDVEVPGTLTVDGKTYPNVGISFRGASSFFSIPAGLKRSLNLSMDFVDDKQRLYGYKTLNLLNCNGDASMMSSYLYSAIANKKIATPKVNFVKVVINGRSWGIYANAQQFNKELLEEHYDTRKGARWKVSGSPRGDGGLRYLGDDVDEYRSRFEIKSKDKEQSWKDLINLCKVLNETPAEDLESKLEPILDIDGALWFLAVDVALINSDGYWTRASDYYIYQHPNGKFHILPHDMNESFRASRGGRRGGPGGRGRQRGPGRAPEGGPPGAPPAEGSDRPPGPPPERDEDSRGDRPPREQRNAGNAQRGGGQQGGSRTGSGYELDPLVGLDQERFPLRSKLLANPTFKRRYLEYVRTIARDFIAWEQLGPRVEKARKLIEKEVKADTRKLMTFEEFENATGNAKSGSLGEFAEKRSEFLLNHPAIKELSELPNGDEK